MPTITNSLYQIEVLVTVTVEAPSRKEADKFAGRVSMTIKNQARIKKHRGPGWGIPKYSLTSRVGKITHIKRLLLE